MIHPLVNVADLGSGLLIGSTVGVIDVPGAERLCFNEVAPHLEKRGNRAQIMHE
jgi:hypothetical protein